MKSCKAVTEDTGGCDQDQYDRKSIYTLAQDSPNTFPVKTFVDKYADDQAVDNCNCCRLSSCEHTAYNAEHYDQNGC